MDKYLHVVAPDLPRPSDSGLLKDLFYLIRGLHNKGVHVLLHCFGEVNEQDLLPFCKEVHSYPKKSGHEGFSLKIPFAVASRSSEKLNIRLMNDHHPVLFVGFQTVFPLLDETTMEKRNVVVRVLRNEHKYFNDLVHLQTWGAQKLFCKAEAFRFKGMMKRLSKSNIPFATAIELETLPLTQVHVKHAFVAPFMPMPIQLQTEGTGNYCFFYGNLGEVENEYAALWLLNNVFAKLELPFVIAGDHPSEKLERAAHLRMHTCLVANPGEKELQDLIKKAQVNILPSFVSGGPSNNILQALALGRHVVTNTMGSKESEIQAYCHIAEHPAEFIKTISALFNKAMDSTEHEKRASLLNRNFNNEKGIQELLRMLY